MLQKVRSVVLHPKSMRKHKLKKGKTLDECSLANISEAIFIILLRALYKRLGISDAAIEKLGDKDNPVRAKHYPVKV
jgi:DNA-binding Xre family transcriptional regulator